MSRILARTSAFVAKKHLLKDLQYDKAFKDELSSGHHVAAVELIGGFGTETAQGMKLP